MWVRGEFRARWRAWAGLALLIGIGGGAVIAAAAGARRTETAYDRFLVAQDAADVTLFDDGFFGIQADPEAVARLPMVDSVARGSLVFYSLEDNAALASMDDRLGRTINRFRVLEGRMYDSSAADEVVVGFGIARRLDLKVGSTFPLFGEELLESQPPEFAEAVALMEANNLTLKVVGIVAAPGEFPPQFLASYPSIHMTPAFFRRIGNFFTEEPVGPERGTLFVRLKRGAADVPAFREAIAELATGEFEGLSTSSDSGALTERGFHFQAVALWLLAAFGAASVVLIAGQALARNAFLASTEFSSLKAVGASRGQLTAIGLARAAIIGIAAAAVAAGSAVVLSPLAPIGDARLAEPAPGIAFDATAIGVGTAVLIAVAVLGSLIPVWRAAGAKALVGADAADQARPSRVAVAAAAAGLSAPLVAGARLALEPGRGRTAVPIRSTLASLIVAIAVLCGALTFGASLNHLLDTPRLYGVRWDTHVTNYGVGPDLSENVDALAAAPGIAELALGDWAEAEVEGEQVPLVTVAPVRGDVGPPIVEGRFPIAADEVALGAATFRSANARLGSRVSILAPLDGAQPVEYTVVGRTVIAPSGTAGVEAVPGAGALLTREGTARLAGDVEGSEDLTASSGALIRFSPGADHAAVLRAITPLVQPLGPTLNEVEPETPLDIVNFGRVQNLPILVGTILGLVAVSTLAHTVASSVRRRRRELAIMKTMGFVSGQVRGTVASQATTLTALALLAGVPSGIALGRWAWTLFADQLGMVPEAAVPVPLMALVVPAALVVANVVAALPGRAAARIKPSLVLRAD
jgi:hypothetical protein